MDAYQGEWLITPLHMITLNKRVRVDHLFTLRGDLSEKIADSLRTSFESQQTDASIQ